MSKKAKQLLQDLYEDPDDCYEEPSDYAYDDGADYPVISSNAGLKQEKQLSQRARKEQDRLERDNKRTAKSTQSRKPSQSEIHGLPTEPISTVPVKTYCNMCKGSVNGTLLGYFWQPHANIYIPFIEYICRSCGHVGKRSVVSKALPPADFDAYYKL